ncbi:MAG: tetratricopeptide repeat protein [Candidatus Omnitrophota bacterium]
MAKRASVAVKHRLKFAPVVVKAVAKRFAHRLAGSYVKTFVSPPEVSAEIHKEQGFLHFQLGEYTKARDEFFFYLEQVEERDTGIFYMLAMCYKNMDDYKEEADFLKLAERTAKNDPDIINALGESLYNIEEYAEAIIFLEKARRLAPGVSSIYYRLGVCHEKLKKSAEAEHFYKQAIALDPSQLEYRQTLGFLLKSGDRHKESIACLRDALHVAHRLNRRS